jgi:hypothetical protein
MAQVMQSEVHKSCIGPGLLKNLLDVLDVGLRFRVLEEMLVICCELHQLQKFSPGNFVDWHKAVFAVFGVANVDEILKEVNVRPGEFENFATPDVHHRENSLL